MQSALIVILLNLPTLLYCLVYMRRLSKPQYKAVSVFSTISRLAIGWVAINIPVCIAYTSSTGIAGTFDKSVVLSYLAFSALLCSISVVLLAYGNQSRYWKNTYV
ncbi:MAG: hypothetical protein L0H36_00075 [bacterium]|nr:hypothetical protein [bacterium]MDN5835013.1 hypothetical protein [bacterium]